MGNRRSIGLELGEQEGREQENGRAGSGRTKGWEIGDQ